MKKSLSALSLASMVLASGCVTESRAPQYRSVQRAPIPQEKSFGGFDRLRNSTFMLPTQIRPIYASRYPGTIPGSQGSGQRRTYTAVSGLPEGYASRYPGTIPGSQGSVQYRTYTGVSGLPEVPRHLAPPSTGYHARYEQYASNPIYAQRKQPAETRQLASPRRPTPSRSQVSGARREVPDSNRRALALADQVSRYGLTNSSPASASDRLASLNNRQPLNQPPAKGSFPPAAAPLAPGELPMAVPSPGRTGFAKLTGHPNLPEIDVRGILPGTPAEVPDPAEPGRTIQFRVP